jgi:hypothetical protein
MLPSCSLTEEHVSATCQFDGLGVGYCVSPTYVQNELSPKKSFGTPLPGMEFRECGHGQSQLTQIT